MFSKTKINNEKVIVGFTLPIQILVIGTGL